VSNMKVLKIVIAGAFGSGKTTFVKTLSEVVPVETDVPLNRVLDDGKSTTTVAFDYGRIMVRRDLVVHLFGVPGQERFSFMWRIIARGMHGYLFIVDSSSLDKVREALPMYSFFRDSFPNTPHVVAANKRDHPNAVDLNVIRGTLKVPPSIRIQPLIAKDRRSTLLALISLLEDIRMWISLLERRSQS